MLLLVALITRAVSLEFRGKMASPRWRRVWDWSFFGSSLVATLLFGVAVGNGITGVPLDTAGVYAGGFPDLLGPYQLVVGLLTVALFALHGALFLYLKAEGPVQDRLATAVWHIWGTFLVLYLLATIYTLLVVPGAAANFRHYPWTAVVLVGNVLAIAYVPRALFLRRYGRAFLASAATIACMVFLFAMAVFPNLLLARNDPALSWTIYNAASSPTTLTIGLVIAGVGMPFVLAYTGIVYWTFRGKVVLDEHSY
jgi:cytochrome d ubiquinol oxidase subunit II